ncbi:UPF0595 protein C22orf40-like, partial [Cricetulus griseus]
VPALCLDSSLQLRGTEAPRHPCCCDCSLFYSKRVCLPCVQENISAFPQEIQQDVEKRKGASKKPSSHP